jgi:hypothetical protein
MTMTTDYILSFKISMRTAKPTQIRVKPLSNVVLIQRISAVRLGNSRCGQTGKSNVDWSALHGNRGKLKRKLKTRLQMGDSMTQYTDFTKAFFTFKMSYSFTVHA